MDYKSRVLVADDNQVIADTLTTILNQSGFIARAAYTGTMVVEMARDFCPDILIADVIMPDMTGIETGIQMQSIFPSCKVLLFSGQIEAAVLLEKAQAEGHGFDVLAKPVHPNDLFAKLRDMLPLV